MIVKIGDLVKEKKGKRFGGVIVKVEQATQVRVQWSDGTNKLYETKSLESIKPYPSYTRFSR